MHIITHAAVVTNRHTELYIIKKLKVYLVLLG